jgi:hypothetical protein
MCWSIHAGLYGPGAFFSRREPPFLISIKYNTMSCTPRRCGRHRAFTLSARQNSLASVFHPFAHTHTDSPSIIVNSKNDRETYGYTAVDYIEYVRKTSHPSIQCCMPWCHLQSHRTDVEFGVSRPAVRSRQREHDLSSFGVHHASRSLAWRERSGRRCTYHRASSHNLLSRYNNKILFLRKWV